MERKERKKGKGKRKKMRKKEDLHLRPLSAFRRSKFVGSRVKVCLHDKGYASRGMDSSFFGYFNLKGCLAVFSALRGHLVGFLACDKVALFNPTYCPDFEIGFWLGNRGNLDSCPS